MPRINHAANMDAARRERELARCQNSLGYLLTEYLDYGWNATAKAGLTERTHLPVARWMDRKRDESQVAFCCKRGWHKTTMFDEGLVIQEILRNPMAIHQIFTGSPNLSEVLVGAFKSHFRDNAKLRALDPVGLDPRTGKRFNIFPAKQRKFTSCSQGNGKVELYRPYGAKSKGPTIRIQTAATEATGGHVDGIVIFDDIIGKNTVERSGLGGITRWYSDTARKISDAKRFRAVFTMWPGATLYEKWLGSSSWCSMVLPGAVEEDDETIQAKLSADDRQIQLAPSYRFVNPTFWPADWQSKARKYLKTEQRESSGAEFAAQEMCDSQPESEQPWDRKSEQYTGIEQTDKQIGTRGQGVIAVISDPAPWNIGSGTGITEKQRGDGTKDPWSICVVLFKLHGTRLHRVLLNGKRSFAWTPEQGCTVAAEFMADYRTNIFLTENEKYWAPYMRSACFAAKAMQPRKQSNGEPLRFRDYNKADGKNVRFGTLATMAGDGEFWIAESCPREFLDGDEVHTGFLTQARKWRKLEKGKNSLRFDDDADVVARSTDGVFSEDLAPKPILVQNHLFGDEDDDDDYVPMSRYCGI